MLPPQMAPQMPPQQSPGGFASMASAMPPQAPGQGISPPPQGMPQGAPPPAPPGSSSPPQGQGGIPPQVLQMLMQHIQQQMQQQAPQQLAQEGRNGDSMIAHLTPGEMMVPPQVQTPKVLATLNKAYKDKHVQPAQFTAGSPTSSMNPKTGMPEYNFMSAFLPAALGVAGAAAAPFTGGASLGLSSAALAAIGGGLGSAAGGLMTGQTPTQAALSGLGSAAGGYALGGLGGANSAITAGDNALTSAAHSAAGNLGSSAAAPTLFGSQTLGNAVSNFNPLQTAGSALGGYMGGQLGATPKPVGPNLPPGFNTHAPSVGSLPSAQTQLGMNNSIQPMPSFTGYNPATNNPAAYNFYPNG